MNYDLEVLLRSRIPIIAVESRDEAQVIKSLLGACSKQPGGAPAPGATAAARPAEIAATRPVAVVMAEKVHALRHWARDRTVAAD